MRYSHTPQLPSPLSTAAPLSAQTAISAANFVLQQAAPCAAFALCRPPGHHCHEDMMVRRLQLPTPHPPSPTSRPPPPTPRPPPCLTRAFREDTASSTTPPSPPKYCASRARSASQSSTWTTTTATAPRTSSTLAQTSCSCLCTETPAALILISVAAKPKPARAKARATPSTCLCPPAATTTRTYTTRHSLIMFL